VLDMIYDEDRKKWYRIYRGRLIKRLGLEEVIFENIRKAPTEEDFVYSEEKGLRKCKFPPEPKTPS